MSYQETLSLLPSLDTRSLHFCLSNEQRTLAELSENQAFLTVEKQVMHYLLERVLMVKNPYLFEEKDHFPYSYKYLETTNEKGQKTLLPTDYDSQTNFIQLCANPYMIEVNNLTNKKLANPLYQPTDKELRVLHRREAEMLGAMAFQEMVSRAPDNSFFIWTSPPGNKLDGYWDLSLTFLAQVKPINQNQREVTCWRCITHLENSQHLDFLNYFLPKEQQLPLSATPEDIILQPVLLTPFSAKQYKLKTIHELIGLLYKFDGQKLDMTKINHQIEKIAQLKAVLAPLIDNLARLLITGQLDLAEKVLDAIEINAITNFFTSCELMEMIAGQNLSVKSPVAVNLDALVAFAWQIRRQEMSTMGTSCPAVLKSQTLQTINPSQFLLDQMKANLGISKSSEPKKCSDCSPSSNHACCKGCQFK